MRRQNNASIASTSVLSSGLLRSSSIDSMDEWVLFSPPATNASIRSHEGPTSIVSVEENEPLELPAHDGAGTFQERISQWQNGAQNMESPFEGLMEDIRAEEESNRPSLWSKLATSINGLFMDSNALDAMLASDWTTERNDTQLSHQECLEDMIESLHYRRACNFGPTGWDDELVKRVLTRFHRDFPDSAVIRALIGRLVNTKDVNLPPAPPLLEPHPVQLHWDDWEISSTMSTTTAVF